MKLQEKNDHELVHLYITGQETCLEELIRRHKSKVYTSIYMLVKDQYLAEDIFQDTFIKVVNTLKAGKYNEEGKFLPWVLRIAHNLVIDHFRKEKRTPVITSGDGFDIFDVLFHRKHIFIERSHVWIDTVRHPSGQRQSGSAHSLGRQQGVVKATQLHPYHQNHRQAQGPSHVAAVLLVVEGY